MVADRKLSQNIIYNLLGSLAPLLAAVVTIPIYIKMVGETRYGVLALVWLALGYFGIFDLGLSRATAYRLAATRREPISVRAHIFYTACALSLGIGTVAAAFFYITASIIFPYLISNQGLLIELFEALPWITMFAPIGLLGGIFAGCMQAEERFLALNLQQSFGAVLFQCLPLLFVNYWAASLKYAVIGAVIARIVSVVWLGVSCFNWSRFGGRPSIRPKYARQLLSYGGWIAFSDIIAPLLNGLDQIIISYTLGAKSNAHYSIPFGMASKVLILPEAINRAIFPRLSALGIESAKLLSVKSLLTVSYLMAAICVPGIILSRHIIEIWIGKSFADEAHWAASILLIGMWFNSVAYTPYTLLQATGRPSVIAKVHAIEITPFVSALFFLIWMFGLPGAAAAWCLRMLSDAILQFWYAEFKLKDVMALLFPACCVMLSACTAAMNMSIFSSVVAAVIIDIFLFALILIKKDATLLHRSY